MSELSLNEVYKATHVLKSIIKPTALIKAPSVNPSADIYIKPENLQITGSFKVRGASYKISQLIANEGANVTSVMHERTNTEISVNACTLRITMETRNADHIKIILDKLKDNGIRILSIPFQLC